MAHVMYGRPCMVKVSVVVERTDEELYKLHEEMYGRPPAFPIGTTVSRYVEFYNHHRKYRSEKMIKARWHMFAQETEEDNNGNVHYPVAIVEFEDGTVKTVNAENIKFIKEEE